MMKRKQHQSTTKRSFSLVELLVTITIIGILVGMAVIIFPEVQAKGRDGRRRADLQSLQQAVELYYADHNSYPSTAGVWWGQCEDYLDKTATCGANTFIPTICPDYIGNIPRDPKYGITGGNKCYLYKSNGTDYMILAHRVMETVGDNPGPDDPMDRPCCIQPTIAVYTPGARDW